MFRQRTEEESLPRDVAGDAEDEAGQGRSLPGLERGVVISHWEHLASVKAFFQPELVHQMLVLLLGLAIPHFRDYEVVQDDCEVRGDVAGMICDPSSKFLIRG